MSEKVFVLTGNTGTGKTTVANYLADFYQVPKVVTHTTRLPREGEQNGIDYYFETDASFETMHYLERVEYNQQKYGSSYEGLELAWQKNQLITIVLDTAGAVTYARELGDKAVIIFMSVTNEKELHDRLIERGDNAAMIEKRLHSAEFARDLNVPEPLQGIAHVVLNDEWSDTKHEIDQIIQDVINTKR
ncbi:MAG: guanylate kinase [Lactobacillaceae bacterium]|jgi:guanylate kinase|nr:guanylate kinase [Lactobacillaceae bacterium]